MQVTLLSVIFVTVVEDFNITAGTYDWCKNNSYPMQMHSDYPICITETERVYYG